MTITQSVSISPDKILLAQLHPWMLPHVFADPIHLPFPCQWNPIVCDLISDLFTRLNIFVVYPNLKDV